MEEVSLLVNGRTHVVEVDPSTPLLYVLRNNLGFKAAKYGCGDEQCGSCRVLVDGVPTYSCSTPVVSFQESEIITVEGLSDTGVLGSVQRAFIDERAAQCGYCISGILVTVFALTGCDPAPTGDQIREALSGHLCRCGTHARIIAAVHGAIAETRS